MNGLILAHGGSAGFLIEAAIIVVPLMIVFYLLSRSGKGRDEDEET
ncbi:MAG: hypothetical protein M3454_17445 [Actinomycetota bacterium]|nr:hypothetical protein [Actinomycetota bacterium]